MIRVEVFSLPSGDSSVTDFMNFHLPRSKMITIRDTTGKPYPYCISWSLGKMRYKLKICRLSLVSELIALNHLFQVRHIWQ